MSKFKITYLNPERFEKDVDEVLEEEICEFKDTGEITAEEWAEDYAYGKSDKGEYVILKLKEWK